MSQFFRESKWTFAPNFKNLEVAINDRGSEKIQRWDTEEEKVKHEETQLRLTYSWWSLKLWSSRKNWILKDISCMMTTECLAELNKVSLNSSELVLKVWRKVTSLKFIPDYSRSSRSGRAPRDLKQCISSRSACQRDCWALGWDGIQPASCGPAGRQNGSVKYTVN